MSATYRFVFDGGTGYTQVELAILLDAGVDQGLNRGFFLEQQEGVAWKWRADRDFRKKKKHVMQLIVITLWSWCLQLCPLGNNSETSEYSSVYVVIVTIIWWAPCSSLLFIVSDKLCLDTHTYDLVACSPVLTCLHETLYTQHHPACAASD